jgi:hypothetical protein
MLGLAVHKRQHRPHSVTEMPEPQHRQRDFLPHLPEANNPSVGTGRCSNRKAAEGMLAHEAARRDLISRYEPQLYGVKPSEAVYALVYARAQKRIVDLQKNVQWRAVRRPFAAHNFSRSSSSIDVLQVLPCDHDQRASAR